MPIILTSQQFQQYLDLAPLTRRFEDPKSLDDKIIIGEGTVSIQGLELPFLQTDNGERLFPREAIERMKGKLNILNQAEEEHLTPLQRVKLRHHERKHGKIEVIDGRIYLRKGKKLYRVEGNADD